MARDVEAGKAFVRLTPTGQAQVKAAMAGLRTQMSSFAGFAAKITASLGAIGLGAGFIASIKAASDMQETMSKFNVVFGESAEAMKKWGDELAANIGRSKKEVTSFLASSQDLLVPLGFDATAAEDLSKQIVKLTFDLGSFNNMADEDVFRDLQAALTGSGEVMKKYGVVVNEARVKQELLNQSIDPKVATEAQKAFARLQIILQGTAAAQGDAIRTGDGFANQWKRLTAVIEDAKVSLGERFLPAITTLVQVAGDAIIVLSGMANEGEKGAVGFDKMAVSAETLTASLADVVDALSKITAALKFVLVGFGLLDPKMRRAMASFDTRKMLESAHEIRDLLEDTNKLWNSDFGAEFEKRMKDLREAREKAKGTSPDSLSGGDAPGVGQLQAAIESIKTTKKMSPETEKAMNQLLRREEKLTEQVKKGNDKQAELTRDQTKAIERQTRILEDMKRQGQDITPVEVLD